MAEEVVESSTSGFTGSRKRQLHYIWLEHLRHQSLSPSATFLPIRSHLPEAPVPVSPWDHFHSNHHTTVPGSRKLPRGLTLILVSVALLTVLTNSSVLTRMWFPPPCFMVYVSFSTNDMYNWKTQRPQFSQNPQAPIGFLESVFHTHQLTWGDCQQFLATHFMAKEENRIWLENGKAAFSQQSRIAAGQCKLDTVGPHYWTGTPTLTKVRRL